MDLTKTEKALLKYLLEQELKKFEQEGETIRPTAGFLAAEENYELLLKNLLKKLG